jgi:hypothetical protein
LKIDNFIFFFKLISTMYSYLSIKNGIGNKHLAIKIFIYAFPKWAFDKLRFLPDKIYLMHDIDDIRIEKFKFQAATQTGKLKVVQYIFSIYEKQNKQENIFSNMFWAFRYAAQHGHLETVKYLYSICEKTGRQKEIFVCEFWAFRYAAQHGHLETVKYLYSICEKLGRQTEIFRSNFAAFVYAAKFKQTETLKYLCSISEKLGYAEVVKMFRDEKK